MSGYVDKYDVAMPEVARIERAFPTPSTEDNIKKVYPAQRDAAKAALPLYREALTSAEKASSRPIANYGAQSLNRGAAIWTGYAAQNKARLGQFWMGWAAPADCDVRAKSLKEKSDLAGQMLSANATSPGEVLSASTDPVAAADVAIPASIDDILDAPVAPADESSPPADGAPSLKPTVGKPGAKPQPIRTTAKRQPELRGTR